MNRNQTNSDPNFSEHKYYYRYSFPNYLFVFILIKFHNAYFMIYVWDTYSQTILLYNQ